MTPLPLSEKHHGALDDPVGTKGDRRGKIYGQICKEASEIKIASTVDCDDACFLSPESMVTAVQDYCRNTRQQVPVTLPEIASVIYNSLAKCYADTKQRIEKLTGNTFDRIYIIGGGSQADYLNELTAKYAQCKVSGKLPRRRRSAICLRR